MAKRESAHATALIVRALSDDGAPDASDQPLIDGLGQRGLNVQIVHGPPAAMVSLARQAVTLLIVVNPRSQERSDELIDAVGRYFPHVACWAYHPGRTADSSTANAAFDSNGQAAGQAQLQRLVPKPPTANHATDQQTAAEAQANDSVDDDHEEPDASPIPLHGSAANQAPSEAANPSSSAAETSPDDDDQPLVSEAELAMLLGE